MNSGFRSWVLISFIVMLFAGWQFTALTRVANAQAPSFVLPPIFEEGARLIGPTGLVEIHEVDGGWIRVKSLSVQAKPEEELWMYVPALSGAWTVDLKPIDTRQEREDQNGRKRQN